MPARSNEIPFDADDFVRKVEILIDQRKETSFNPSPESTLAKSASCHSRSVQQLGDEGPDPLIVEICKHVDRRTGGSLSSDPVEISYWVWLASKDRGDEIGEIPFLLGSHPLPSPDAGFCVFFHTLPKTSRETLLLVSSLVDRICSLILLAHTESCTLPDRDSFLEWARFWFTQHTGFTLLPNNFCHHQTLLADLQESDLDSNLFSNLLGVRLQNFLSVEILPHLSQQEDTTDEQRQFFLQSLLPNTLLPGWMAWSIRNEDPDAQHYPLTLIHSPHSLLGIEPLIQRCGGGSAFQLPLDEVDYWFNRCRDVIYADFLNAGRIIDDSVFDEINSSLFSSSTRCETIRPGYSTNTPCSHRDLLRESRSSDSAGTSKSDTESHPSSTVPIGIKVIKRLNDFNGSGDYRCLLQGVELKKVQVNPWAWQSSLDLQFPWMSDLTARLTRRLSIQQTRGLPLQLPNLVLLGAGGIGKTFYWRYAISLLQHPFDVVNLAGASDSLFIHGVSAGWSTEQPGIAARLMAQKRCANPVVVLDDLDRAGGSIDNGRVDDALLCLLDTNSARAYHDVCLQTSLNASRMSWVGTAKDESALSGGIRNRLEVFEAKGPDWSNPLHLDAAMRVGEEIGMRKWGNRPLQSSAGLTDEQKDRIRHTRWQSLRSLSRQVDLYLENNLYLESVEKSLHENGWHHQQAGRMMRDLLDPQP